MKMALIAYCESADIEIVKAIKETGIKGYTKFEEALGEGTETQPRLGTHCWPGKNNVLAIAIEDDEVDLIINKVKLLKSEYPRAGIRAFILPMEQMV
ncbi:MAG: hypothetical protein N2738_00700 [Thermodesulfovibrionales bacterium]|nr:hypothetical protein [Thermodesulfovibrionales bacterium]